ncbi:unnamed protein product [Phytomonas sp. Hart1]|nr:unnamed protein product [Phytomonas sp. Hart1]|eukprot:CCW71446.1 unnamed protein product [Phytomonas sp. isolate Hart1]
MQYLQSSRTVYTVVGSTRNPNQCLVSIHNYSHLREAKAENVIDHWRAFCRGEVDTAGLSMHDPVNLSADEERGIAARHIHYVWDTFLNRVLTALDQTITDELFATLNTNGVDSQYQKEYNEFESAYCKWAATSSATLSRVTVVEATEPALTSWAQALHELKQQRMIMEGVKKDAESSQRISAEIAKQMVEQQDALQEVLLQQKEKEDVEGPDTIITSSSSSTTPRQQRKLSSEKDVKVTPVKKRVYFPKSRYIYSSDILLANHSENLLKKVGQLKTNDPSWRTGCTPNLISELFDRNGEMDEQIAQEIFDSLVHVSSLNQGRKILMEDDKYLTASELTALLLSVETFENKVPSTVPSKTAADKKYGIPAADAVNSLPVDSALRKMVNKHDILQKELREKVMQERAEDAISRYDFRENGRLYFDEFCLALMNLFKTQRCV